MTLRHFRANLCTTLAVVVLAVFVLARTAAASVAFCEDDVGYDQPIDDNVSSSTDCQIGTTDNDRIGEGPDEHQVNLDMMFGFDDWIYAERGLEDDEAIDVGLSIVGDTISGQWSIDDIWNTMGVSSLMLVFKGGSAEPDNYVGYLLTPETTGGDYLTPFINAASGNPKDISHISVYFRTGGPSVLVPEPGSIALLCLGLLAMTGALTRRYRWVASRTRAK